MNPNLAGRKSQLSLAGISRSQLGALLVVRLLNTLELLAHVLDVGSTSIADLSLVAVVGVDSNKGRHVTGLDVLDHDGARALALVVAAVTA